MSDEIVSAAVIYSRLGFPLHRLPDGFVLGPTLPLAVPPLPSPAPGDSSSPPLDHGLPPCPLRSFRGICDPVMQCGAGHGVQGIIDAHHCLGCVDPRRIVLTRL